MTFHKRFTYGFQISSPREEYVLPEGVRFSKWPEPYCWDDNEWDCESADDDYEYERELRESFIDIVMFEDYEECKTDCIQEWLHSGSAHLPSAERLDLLNSAKKEGDGPIRLYWSVESF